MSGEESENIPLLSSIGIDVQLNDELSQDTSVSLITDQLHDAIADGDVQLCRSLIESGQSVEVKDSKGWTPLHHAASSGHAYICTLLLKHKANTEPRDRNNCTPLHVAAREGQVDICNILLKHGANVGAADRHLNTPLHKAVYKGQEDISPVLSEHDPTFEAQGRRVDTCSLLLKHKANIEAKNKELLTPLYLAAQYGETDLCSLFIRNGASLYSVGHDGRVVQTSSILLTCDPSVMHIIFDSCIKTSREGHKYDFKCFNTSSHVHSSDPMTGIIKDKSLAAHPLVKCYVDDQWESFGKKFWCVQFAMNFIFLTIFTALVCLSKEHEQDPSMSRPLFILSWFSIIYSLVMLTLEAFHFHKDCYSNKTETYFRRTFDVFSQFTTFFCNLRNCVQLILYVTVISFSINCIIGRDGGSTLGSVAILLAWIEFSFSYSTIEESRYTMMFKQTFINVFYAMCHLFPAVVGFGLAFYVLRDNEFPKPGYSILKSLAMSIGTLGDFSDLFSTDKLATNSPSLNTNTASNVTTSVPLSSGNEISRYDISLVIYVVFLLVMAISFTNLLIGIAVSDVDELRKSARIFTTQERWEYTHTIPRFIVKQPYPSDVVTRKKEYISEEERKSIQANAERHTTKAHATETEIEDKERIDGVEKKKEKIEEALIQSGITRIRVKIVCP